VHTLSRRRIDSEISRCIKVGMDDEYCLCERKSTRSSTLAQQRGKNDGAKDF